MATTPNYIETRRFENVAIVGGGLSLAGYEDLFNIEMNREIGHLIVVNDAWRAIKEPGDVVTIDTSRLDQRFEDCPWKPIIGVPEGYSEPWAQPACDRHPLRPGWKYMRRVTQRILSGNPSELASGENSGFAALNLAVHMMPRRIFLFGIDLVDMRHHWHEHSDERRENRAVTKRVIANFNMTRVAMKRLRIEVINCSRMSAISAFPHVSPPEGVQIWNTLST